MAKIAPSKNPTLYRRALAFFILCAVFCFLAGKASAAAFAFADNFKGVEVALPDGQKKLYPNPGVWAFTFWPGTKWPDSYGDGTNWLANNGECQTYVTPFLESVLHNPIPASLRYDPFSIQPDGLHIKASLLTPEQQEAYHVGGFRRFGSGMLLSHFSFTYGQVRMIAKLPSVRGSWPAFWLLPDTHQWPPEIDIFEGMVWGPHVNQLHTALLTPKSEKGRLEWTNIGVDPSKDFHEYGLDWGPAVTAILFDGKKLWEIPTPPSMNQDMYLVINLAVGGKWPFNELKVLPLDSMDPQRLAAGADLIQPNYPADMIVKSVSVASPSGSYRRKGL